MWQWCGTKNQEEEKKKKQPTKKPQSKQKTLQKMLSSEAAWLDPPRAWTRGLNLHSCDRFTLYMEEEEEEERRKKKGQSVFFHSSTDTENVLPG